MIGVSLCASSGSLEVLVENVKRVDVSRGELRGVNICEETSSLVEGSNISAADVREAISGLDTVVLPTFNFYDSHEVIEGHVSSSSLTSDLLNIETGGSESVVKCLSKEDICSSGIEVFID